MWVAALLTVVIPALAQDAHSEASEMLYTIGIGIEFEVEELNIPGWEGGPYSEPVGEGMVELRLVFPGEGGHPVMQAGDARITRYGCRGNAGCVCTAPPELFERLWTPVFLDQVELNRDSMVITLKGPPTYPDDETTVRVQCGPSDVRVEDHPLYKLLGAFGPDNEQRKLTGFHIPLTGSGPWEKTFDRELFALGPKVFRAKLIVTVTEGRP